MPQAQDGTLRKFALRVPEVIYQCSGIMVFGKRIKSLVFSTDLSIIKNVNADAIIAVYPFTPQPIITQALLLAADIPVFAGVGGGLTQGQRVVNLAMFAEMQGATGVVLNAPTANAVVQHVAETIDIPVVVTVARADTDFDARLQSGTNIFNVSAASETPAIVRRIRERYPDVPIIATLYLTAFQTYILLHKFSSCQASDTRLKLLQMEGLFHIIICPRIQCFNLIRNLPSCR